ncbi:peroxisomal sarcosine oxidase-like isoform X2 [Homarus americanus]|uniref:peroxisomal sarcosine oxidase-like isoform X2 n=1 Tax=Homarus americanus TaxID=6706 RepID=UPI001C437221|nr:peroxisomal sarcosine oxidase-like isoform X2 [Homarus americanus]
MPSQSVSIHYNMSTEEYQVAVVGGGVIGTCAAYSLVKAGKKTVLLDQFTVPHAHGSSGGMTRITRTANSGPPQLTPIMDDAFKQWLKISDIVNQELISFAPMLVVSHELEDIKNMAISVERTGHTPNWLTPEETNAKYMTRFPKDSVMFEDTTAGVMRADMCLSAVRELYRSAGGTLLESWPVKEVETGHPLITLRGPQGVIRAKGLILCPGPWASNLLMPLGVNLPLSTMRTKSFYWKIKDEFPHSAFVGWGAKHVDYYAMTALGRPGHVKVGLHDGKYVRIDGEEPDLSLLREQVVAYFTKYFPVLGDKPVDEELCWYTITPDEEFILDCHPQHNNIVYAVGFSGTGFKLAPTIGNILAAKVLGQHHGFDLSPFTSDRFTM